MASLSSISPQSFSQFTKPIVGRSQTNSRSGSSSLPTISGLSGSSLQKAKGSPLKPVFGSEKRNWAVRSVVEDVDVIPIPNGDSINLKEEGGESSNLVPIGGFASDGGSLSFESGMGIGDTMVEGFSGSSPSSSNNGGDGDDRMVDRAINAAIVLAAGTFAITKLLTIDHDYWQVDTI